MNIFRFLRDRNRLLNDWVVPRRVQPIERPAALFKSVRADDAEIRIFEPTHVHVATGKQCMLMDVYEGETFHTAGKKISIAFFEDADGKRFFANGNHLVSEFKELPL